MWAGGSLHWPHSNPHGQPQHHLRVGETATEVTKVLSCEPKVIKKTGESMLVVGVEKEFRNGRDELCVVDRRNWVFREALDPSTVATLPVKPPLLTVAQLDELAHGHIYRAYRRDVVVLFRFSALTFNGHRIHYDKPWAQNVEGHRDVVVHGPMNMIAMLDLWRDEAAARQHGDRSSDGVVYPQQLEYRATSPVYAGEGYRILMNEDGISTGRADMRVVSDDGTVCMKGTITGW